MLEAGSSVKRDMHTYLCIVAEGILHRRVKILASVVRTPFREDRRILVLHLPDDICGCLGWQDLVLGEDG